MLISRYSLLTSDFVSEGPARTLATTVTGTMAAEGTGRRGDTSVTTPPGDSPLTTGRTASGPDTSVTTSQGVDTNTEVSYIVITMAFMRNNLTGKP